MKKKVILIAVLFLLVVSPWLVKYARTYKIHRALEYLEISQNNFSIRVAGDTAVTRQVIIKWVGEKEKISEEDKVRGNFYDSLILYQNHNQVRDIPDWYGSNQIIIEYRGKAFDKIGVWKFKPWYKYDYVINLNATETQLLIDWEISNNFERYRGEGFLSIIP